MTPLPSMLGSLLLIAMMIGQDPVPPVVPAPAATAESKPFSFEFDRQYIDLEYGGNGRPGWVRGGDIDLDGDIDLVAGGGNALFVYFNGGSAKGWQRSPSVDGTKMIGANAGVLIDVDRDGDLDVVSALYYRELGWWENPGSERVTLSWIYHRITKEKWFLHDLTVADLDGDGEAREIVGNFMNKGMKAKSRIVAFSIPKEPTGAWPSITIQPGRDHGSDNHAGLDVGDIDRDGVPDVAFANGWYRAPTEENGSWTWSAIHARGGVSNVALRDLDGDGRLDVITTLGHRSRGIYWYRAPRNGGEWQENLIHAQLIQPESLAVVDIDQDGDLDLVTSDLDDRAWNREVHNVYIFENRGVDRDRPWRQHNVSPNGYASHLVQAIDVNGDGWLDLISEGCGHSIVTYLENRGPGE